MSFFENIELLPSDPIYGLQVAFNADTRPNKVNLGIGSYKDAEGESIVLTSVSKAEELLIKQNLNKEYLPIEGDSEFLKESLKLIFGEKCKKIESGEIFAAQTVGGTFAIRLGAEFLAQELSKTVYVSNPTWPNHLLIFKNSGFKIDFYRYYDPLKNSLDFEGMCKMIKMMPPSSVILLQASCHNPTGIEPTFDQWKEISVLIKEQKIIPFFDFAYQGFGKGIEEDAKTIRYFLEEGHEMLVASSYSKNFGLYGERIGVFSIVTHNVETARKIGSQIRQIIRSIYSSPPLHGARLIKTILKSPELRKDWVEDLDNMRMRIQEMRQTFVSGLLAKGINKDLSFMYNQAGLFSLCGLDQDQVHSLNKEYAIYMPNNGRINIAGLNLHNMNYVINSILSVNKPKCSLSY